MKKNIFSLLVLIAASLVLFTSCAKKKSEILTKDKEWLYKEVVLGEVVLDASVISGKYVFRADSSFSRLENGKTEDGKWALSADEKKLLFSFAETGEKAEYEITELTEEKLVIKGKEVGMDRKYTLTASIDKK